MTNKRIVWVGGILFYVTIHCEQNHLKFLGAKSDEWPFWYYFYVGPNQIRLDGKHCIALPLRWPIHMYINIFIHRDFRFLTIRSQTRENVKPMVAVLCNKKGWREGDSCCVIVYRPIDVGNISIVAESHISQVGKTHFLVQSTMPLVTVS